tara:strand:+ start:6167 stop:6568 length:402 start_codon:yes stop_codon:yes gene_type:complete
MKIYLNNVPLAKGLAHKESPTGLSLKTHQQVQMSHALRAAQVSTYSRGNTETAITFKVKRTHPDIQTAIAFTLTHASALDGRSGKVFFTDETNAQAPQGFTLLNASLQVTQAYLSGRNSYHTYTLVGGKIINK